MQLWQIFECNIEYYYYYYYRYFAYSRIVVDLITKRKVPEVSSQVQKCIVVTSFITFYMNPRMWD